MNRLSFVLILVLLLSLPCFADTISGTVSTSTGTINVVTPESVALSLPSANNSGPITVDPITGAFSFHFDIGPIVGWGDTCNPGNLAHCSSVDFFGNLSGTLSSLPTFNGTYWIIPNQSLTLHSTSNIFYAYVAPGGAVTQSTVNGVQTQFLLALNNFVFLPGGVASFGTLSLDATFPDPTPEPASMFLVFTGAGLLWKSRRRNVN
jgi:hypothetical protein